MVDMSVGTLRFLRHEALTVVPNSEYSPLSGLPTLRAAIASMEGVPDDRVTVTTGAMGALLTALTLPNRQGSVMVPRPYFPSYPNLVASLGHRTVYYDAEPSIAANQVLARISSTTVAVIWNYPHNPTGWTDNPDDAARVARACRESGAFLLADRVYEDICEATSQHAPLIEGEIRVKSLSKVLGLTGERIGYALADAKTIARLADRHWQLISTPPTAGQTMASRLIADMPNLAEHVRDELQVRHRIVRDALRACGRVAIEGTASGMFAWFRAHGLRSTDAAIKIERSGVRVLGGPTFGVPDEAGYVRANIAIDEDAFHEGLKRIAGALTPASP